MRECLKQAFHDRSTRGPNESQFVIEVEQNDLAYDSRCHGLDLKLFWSMCCSYERGVLAEMVTAAKAGKLSTASQAAA